MTKKRDGKCLTDLALFCDQMQSHVRRLAQGLRSEVDERDGVKAKAGSGSGFQRSMRSLSTALQELVSVLPRVPSLAGAAGAGIDSRLLALGLITQWLDRDGEIAEKSRRGIHGHTDTMELGSVIELIAHQRKNGLLRVRGKLETVSLEFKEGDVVHAISDNAPISDRLGEILVAQGSLERDVLKKLLNKYADSRRKLGTHFEIQQLVGEEGLRKALEQQVQRLFNRLFAMQDAYFEFIEDAAGQQLQKVRLGAMSLLLESAHVLDTTREGVDELRGDFDLGAVFDDEEQRAQITANAVYVSGVHRSVVDAEDDVAPSAPEASNTEREPEAQDAGAEADEAEGAEGEGDAGSFLRKYGIGTRAWISKQR